MIAIPIPDSSAHKKHRVVLCHSEQVTLFILSINWVLRNVENRGVGEIGELFFFSLNKLRGAWVAQSVERQLRCSQFMSSSPTSGSVLTAWSLESASGSVSPSLSVPPPLMLTLCLSLSKANRQ